MELAGPHALPPRRRSPVIGAVLSFLWPGLGQWYGGQPRAAAAFSAPLLLLVAAVLLVAVSGLGHLAELLITPSSALTVLILVVLLGLWRILAISDAAARLSSPGTSSRRRGIVVAAVLAAAVLITHGWAGYVTWSFWDASQRVFVAGNPEATPRPTPVPGTTESPDEEFLVPPLVEPESPQARVNILLTGIDSAETRTHSLTDTMLVVSVDPESGAVGMVSFPRDIADFPIWKGGTFSSKINSFMSWARRHPDRYPDGPLPSLQLQLGFLLGIPIHYYAAVDMAGFRRMIDAVGGVTVVNERLLDDPRYDWFDGRRGFRLSVGTHTLDGQTALAYVRSRFSAGDSDFQRAKRQQQVILSLARKLITPEMLPRMPELIQLAGDTVRTNFPQDRVGEFITIAQGVDDDAITQVVLGPPFSIRATGPGVTDYRLHLDMDRLARLSVRLFGDDSSYATR